MYTGEQSWITWRTRPDLSYTVLTMSKKNATAMIADLHNMNRVLKKVEMKESGVCYGKREELKKIGIGDASFKTSKILLMVQYCY